jgi:hypothetical protein
LFGYHLLKAMDRTSLDVCSGEDLFETIEEVYPRPGAKPLTLRVGHPHHFELTLDPWPFGAPVLTYDIPCRRLPAQRYESEAEFHRFFNAAEPESVRLTVRRQ